MGNIISYLDNYADVSFESLPFNPVDNLVLCTLSYCNLKNIIPSDDNNTVSVANASEAFYSDKDFSSLVQVEQILYKMASGRRFSNARLYNYVNHFDIKNGIGFCALHIALCDNTTFISIRGTDDSVTGWHENFCLSYEIIPSQHIALKYVKDTMKSNCIYRIGGHSKGGNLALYSAMMCPPALQSQILKIYCNDSPGILVNFTDPGKLKTISDKIIRIVPEFNIIGSIFEKEPPTIIVKTSKKGIISHDALTWCVEGNHFLAAKTSTKKSRIYSKLCSLFIDSLNFSQRKKIVDCFFLIIENSGIKEMSKLNLKCIIKLIISYVMHQLVLIGVFFIV